MVSGVELIRVALLVIAVGAVYAVTAVVLLRRLVARWRRTPGDEPRPFSRFERATLALAGLGLVCVAYARFVEPRWLEVTERTIRSAKLPPGTPGLRIVHLSDIHSDPAALLEDDLPGVVAALRPDVIVFTGDAANSPAGVPVFRRCIERIAAIAPTYAVKGNWDIAYFPEIDRFGGTGVIEVDGWPRRMSVTHGTRRTPLQVTGLAMWNDRSSESVLRDLDSDVFTVFLYHAPYPDVIPTEAAEGVDLMCAGHVHGGQVALPFYGALITLSKYGKRYERGLYRVGHAWLHVSRGIGMEGGAVPRVRFSARPEVTLIKVLPAD